MGSFLVMLLFAPVLLGVTWVYMSPLPRLDVYTPWKVIIGRVLSKTAFFVLVLGGLFAQLNFLAHNVPSNTRRFWVMALLIMEAVPMLWIVFYRYYQNPGSYGAKRGDRIGGSEKEYRNAQEAGRSMKETPK